MFFVLFSIFYCNKTLTYAHYIIDTIYHYLLEAETSRFLVWLDKANGDENLALEYHTHKKRIPPNTTSTNTTEHNHPSPNPTESTHTESAATSIQEGTGEEKNERAIVNSQGADNVNKERDTLSTREGDVLLNKPTVSVHVGDILFIFYILEVLETYVGIF